ncbi:MAG: undecaprenyldiphospho-muramoylpentapeptide beta-N-acetylglucosaminyltransferase [Acetobacteraceae bacterium]|nr:undecaprenyldiphospho-muramoylpentapeptide beta-N-acetylglucosaminyltransferase [Acetobacteraceae bacterium]
MSAAFVLAAGGTGGHLFPAEALARQLAQTGAAVHLATDRRADTFAADAPGITTSRIQAGRIGADPLSAVVGIGQMALGILQARRMLRRLDPEAVVGFGGYPSIPTLLAATQLGFPTMIHEQNAVLGRANRFLAPHADALALSFAETARVPSGARTVLTGNPVRPAVASIAPYAAPDEGGALCLLVLGGSLGARVFSDVVPDAVAALPEALRARLYVVQQCRAEDLERVGAAYARTGVPAKLAAFFPDVAARLADAHMVIARAGASTVAELAVAGRPAILVPLPGAIDDHQSANARALVDAGAAAMIAQSALAAPVLAASLAALLDTPDRLGAMAAAARGQARPDAAQRLADLIDTLIAQEARA